MTTQQTKSLRTFVLLLILIVALFLVVGYWIECEGAEVPDNMWQGLLAESANQGYDGLYAVACCYRNRLDNGLPLGCVGLKRNNLDKWIDKNTTEKHRKWAKDIVNKVFMTDKFIDKVGGADHYENIKAFKKPAWASKMTKTCVIKDHTFWKSRK